MRATPDLEISKELNFSKQQAHLNIMTYLDVETQNGDESDYFSQEQGYQHETPIKKKAPSKEAKVDRSFYIDIDKLTSDGEDEPTTNHLERSYERDSKWKPHLSWSFLNWSLQQRMEEQAAQREMQWQKIADKLGPFWMVDEGCYLGRGNFSNLSSEERVNERVPFIPPTQTTQQKGPKYTGTKQGHNLNQCETLIATYCDQQKKGKRRCIIVSGILIALIMLLFTIIILMGTGILHR